MAEQGTLRKLTRCFVTVLGGFLVLVVSSGVALAHQSPAGCTANRLSVDIARDLSVITSGDTVNYTVTITNPGAGSGIACDVSPAYIVFDCPAADGTATGTETTLTSTGNYPANGSGNICYNSGGTGGCTANAGLACVVTVNAGVTQANADVQAGDPTLTDKTKGALHDVTNDSAFSINKAIGVTVVACIDATDCNDGLFCTDDACVSNVCQHTAHSCAPDSNLCTTESCDEDANACVSGAPRTCNDDDVCTDDSCVQATGNCSFVFDETNDASCVEVSGRMTGGGSVFTAKGGTRVTHGFELHCDPEVAPNNLEVNWNGNHFHMEELLTASCIDAPGIDWPPSPADFDTYIGTGVGRCNGVAGATISFTFTDAGEPGSKDTANIVISGCPDSVDISVDNNLKKGNHQAHK